MNRHQTSKRRRQIQRARTFNAALNRLDSECPCCWSEFKRKGIVNPDDLHAKPRVTVLSNLPPWPTEPVHVSELFVGDNRVSMEQIRDAYRSGDMRRVLAVHEAINRAITADP